MSDTIRSMRFAMLATVTAIVVACGSDPSLEVVVTHPTTAMVEETTVTDYESTTLTCEDVEFSRLDAAQLEAVAVTSESIGAGGEVTGSLSGMSRTDNKVLVARGFAAGKLVAAGCTQKGEVTGQETVKITTHIAATASIKPPGMDLSEGVTVTLTDASGTALDDERPISWTVYGPYGSTAANSGNATVEPDPTNPAHGVWQPAKPSCAASIGAGRVHPNPPMTVGGYAVQVRPAWAVELPPLYTSLTNADFTPLALAGAPPSTVRQFCAIHVFNDASQQKQRLLTCIDGATNVQHYKPNLVGGRITTLSPVGPTQSVPAGTIAIVAVPVDTTSDFTDVYAIASDGTVTALFNSAAANNTGTGCPIACDDAIVVPPCGATPGRLLLAVKASGNIRELGARGGNGKSLMISDAVSITLDNAGCVTQLVPGSTSTVAQFATFHAFNPLGVNFATRLVACPLNQDCKVAGDLTRGAGVGFTGGGEPRMVATTVDASGVVLVQLVLGPTGGSIERSRMAAAGVPDRVGVAQLDGDHEVDLVWNMASRAQATSFEVGYHVEVGNTGQALEALSGLQDANVQSIQAIDFDNNGFDDLVVLSGGKVSVIPIGVNAPVVQNSDSTCDP